MQSGTKQLILVIFACCTEEKRKKKAFIHHINLNGGEITIYNKESDVKMSKYQIKPKRILRCFFFIYE